MLISEVRIIERRYHYYRNDIRNGVRYLMPTDTTQAYQTSIIHCINGNQHEISRYLKDLLIDFQQMIIQHDMHKIDGCEWAAHERSDLSPPELWVYSTEYVMGNCGYPVHAIQVQAELQDMRLRTSPYPAS